MSEDLIAVCDFSRTQCDASDERKREGEGKINMLIMAVVIIKIRSDSSRVKLEITERRFVRLRPGIRTVADRRRSRRHRERLKRDRARERERALRKCDLMEKHCIVNTPSASDVDVDHLEIATKQNLFSFIW